MKKVLVADDEAGVRALVRITLDGGAYDIVEAVDGVEALSLAREHHPPLAFVDVRMPRRTGIEVCKELKGDPATSDITVILLTANAQDQEREEGLAAGADNYFTKPFSPVALLDVVDAVFSKGGTT